MARWEHEAKVLAQHGVCHGEWAILITAGYYIPLSRGAFIPHAMGLFNAPHADAPVAESEVTAGLESCLRKGLVRLTPEGHVEKEVNLFGEATGGKSEYPKDGVVLTDAGHRVRREVAFALLGQDYFRE